MTNEVQQYEVDWTTGPNVTAFYKGTVTVYAPDRETAAERGELKARRSLCWDGRLKVVEVREVRS